MKVVLHPEAEEELFEAIRFYESRVTGLGARLFEEIEYAVSQIVNFPEIGARYEQHFRRVLLNRLPLSIVYTIERNEIWIVAIAHQRRRPGYWKHRTR